MSEPGQCSRRQVPFQPPQKHARGTVYSWRHPRNMSVKTPVGCHNQEHKKYWQSEFNHRHHGVQNGYYPVSIAIHIWIMFTKPEYGEV